MVKGARVLAKSMSVVREKPTVSKLRHAADIAVKEILDIRDGEEVFRR